MHLSKRIITTFALTALSFSSPLFAKEPMPASQLYQSITQQNGWLNTARPLTAEDLKGRMILLDFWTFCCINCMHIIPDLQALEHEFGDDLTVIGIHSAKFKNEQDSENIRQAILRYGIEHAVTNDFNFAIWSNFGVRAWPTLVLINPNGMIENIYSGEGNREAIARDVRAMKQKYPGWVKGKLPLALEKSKTPPSLLNFPGKIDYAEKLNGAPAFVLSDSGHHQIRLLNPEGKILETIGSGKQGYKDGDFATAQFNRPQGVLFGEGVIYVADTSNHTLRMIDLKTRQVSTLAGTGVQGFEREAQASPALKTPLASPWDLAFYPDARHLAIAMAGTHQIWSYDIAAKTLSVIAGSGSESLEDGEYPRNALAQTSGLSAYGGKLYFVDSETSSLRVLENGQVSTLIGTGLFDFGYRSGKQGEALLQHPLGVFADASGVYVADSYNHAIRRYDLTEKILENIAGTGSRGKLDGVSAKASFNEPNDLLKIGNNLYVVDTNNQEIRSLDLKSKKTTHLKLVNSDIVSEAEYIKDLPNLEKLPSVSLALGAPIALNLQLAKGWHINEDAPSSLALFSIGTGTPKAILSFEKESLKTRQLTVPKLAAGSYLLQGTLYYCEDKEGAQCLIKSIEAEISTQPKGMTQWTVKVN